MAEQKKRVYVNLKEKDGSFYGEKGGNYYYVFPTGTIKFQETGVAYWLLIFNNKENWEKKINGDRDVKADKITSIKEHVKENGDTRLGGVLFDNEAKQAFFIRMGENSFKTPGSENDMYVSFQETEYRERATVDRESMPF